MSAFKRTIEDFVCEHCGVSVVGDGFTNHCPACLWSKHVDIDPGDRAEMCHGQMKPIDVLGSTPHYSIVQKCEKCGLERCIMARDSDSIDALLAIVRAKKD